MWKVENAVRQGKTGMSCTDVQRKWNEGTRENVGLRKAKHNNFKCRRPGHTYPGPSSLPPDLTTSPQHFKNHAEFVSHSNSSVMAPLFQLQTEGLLQLSFRADVDSNNTSSSEHDTDISHTDHSLTQSCRKCLLFYESYIKLSPTQATILMEESTVQSASQLWHDARKLCITASTAKRVPKRPTTNPQKFLNEHFYPTFKGNTATKYGKENEDNIIQLMKSRGHAVERRGLVIHPEHPWLAASPDGILDSTKLLEIKCPFMSSMSLTEFLNRPNGDIRSLGDGQYVILPYGKDGYYLQIQLTMMCVGLLSCKLVIWTSTEHLEMDIPFDKNYAEAHVQQLQEFYFLHMLPALADDFADKKINVCKNYLQLLNK